MLCLNIFQKKAESCTLISETEREIDVASSNDDEDTALIVVPTSKAMPDLDTSIITTPVAGKGKKSRPGKSTTSQPSDRTAAILQSLCESRDSASATRDTLSDILRVPDALEGEKIAWGNWLSYCARQVPDAVWVPFLRDTFDVVQQYVPFIRNKSSPQVPVSGPNVQSSVGQPSSVGQASSLAQSSCVGQPSVTVTYTQSQPIMSSSAFSGQAAPLQQQQSVGLSGVPSMMSMLQGVFPGVPSYSQQSQPYSQGSMPGVSSYAPPQQTLPSGQFSQSSMSALGPTQPTAQMSFAQSDFSGQWGQYSGNINQPHSSQQSQAASGSSVGDNSQAQVLTLQCSPLFSKIGRAHV